MTCFSRLGVNAPAVLNLPGGIFHHAIFRAGHKQGGLPQLRAVKEWGQFPGAIDIAVPVEAPAKTGTFELGGEELKVRSGWQFFGTTSTL